MLLVEYSDFNYQSEIVEGKDGKPTRIVLKGLFQEGDKPNGNNRVYPTRILEREVKRLGQYLSEKRMIGELDHPPGEVKPRLREASHIITHLDIRGNEMYGQLEILPTQRGKDLQALFEAGVKLGVSSRGTGGLRQLANGLLEVDESYCLNTFDVVNEPSVGNAYISESMQQNMIAKSGGALYVLKSNLYRTF